MAKKKAAASGDLVIVESPAKAKTIEKYLGEGFTVLSSYGHVRDLPERDLSVDVDNGFEPTYIIPDDKKDRLSALKKEADKAAIVWLATDEDREGEAISWHLKEALKLPDDKVKRITFNEITKKACSRPSPTRATSTCTWWTRNRPAACWTGWSGTSSAPSSGAR